MRATAFIAFSINELPTGGRKMKSSYWNSWTGFLTQMISFGVIGILIALLVKNLQNILGG